MREELGWGGDADLVELEPLEVGPVEDALDVGLALGEEGRVGEDEVEARGDVGGPLPHDLLPHDLAAGPEPVQAQEPRPPGAVHPAAGAQAAHPANWRKEKPLRGRSVGRSALLVRAGRDGVCGLRWAPA